MESRLIGKIVSRRFRVEDVIGRGGMAIVYRAFDLKTHQTVALKVLREEYEEDPEFRERFKREAEVCRRLNHPNIVNSIDSGAIGGISYIALEYVDGRTLKEIIAEQGRLEQGEAVRCALQILAALSHAHQRGIIHRDIKPQNILVSRSGQIKIGDFGIAGVADTKTLTSDGNVMGSVHYFSPEQAKGMKATAASDLYSVGVILYEMLCGHVPFEGETAVSVAMKHLMETPTPIEQEATVSQAVALIVAKALEKQPGSRYQTADAMIRDLRRALRHPDGAFMRQREHVRERARRAVCRPPVRGGIVALLISLAVVAAIAVGGVRVYMSAFASSRVPDLFGVDAQTAERLLTSADLTAQLTYAYSDMPEGYVCDQWPSPGEPLRRGDSVLVTVSRGSGLVTVQRYVGLDQDAALAAIAAQGFVPGEIIVVPSEQMKGTVVAQSPEVGVGAAQGSPVILTVSGGRVVVPELTGHREEEALERIGTLGLACGEVNYEQVTDARLDGVVLTQSLEKFTDVLPGSVVDLTVGHYDKRRYTAPVTVTVQVPPEGVSVRVTLVGEDGKESDMYAATHTEPGEVQISVTLRSEHSGVMAWRLYLDGSFRSEATAVLQ